MKINSIEKCSSQLGKRPSGSGGCDGGSDGPANYIASHVSIFKKKNFSHFLSPFQPIGARHERSLGELNRAQRILTYFNKGSITVYS